MKHVNAWDTGNKTYVTYSNDKGHASQMSLNTTQNNVAYEILKMKFIANILCWASLLWVFVVKKIFFLLFFWEWYTVCVYFHIQSMHWYVIEILYRFYKKVFVVPKYPSPLKPYPFCVCFTVFYILNRQTEWN